MNLYQNPSTIIIQLGNQHHIIHTSCSITNNDSLWRRELEEREDYHTREERDPQKYPREFDSVKRRTVYRECERLSSVGSHLSLKGGSNVMTGVEILMILS